jgi:hypothetical protein
MQSILILDASGCASFDVLNEVMTNRGLVGSFSMGEKGETFLVSSSGFLATDTRQIKRNSARMTSEAIKRALAGQSGSGIFTDYKNEKSYVSYSSLTVGGLRYAAISKLNYFEILKKNIYVPLIFLVLLLAHFFGSLAFYISIGEIKARSLITDSIIQTDGEALVSLRHPSGPVVVKLSTKHADGNQYVVGVIEDATEKAQWREIVSFFVDGKLKQAIDLILEIEPDEDKKSEWILLENQIAEIERKKRMGTISDEQYQIDRNRIKSMIAASIKF